MKRRIIILTSFVVFSFLLFPLLSRAEEKKDGSSGRTLGLLLNSPEAYKGYTLFAPKHNIITYLINNDGLVVHSWKSEYEPGQSVYLLPNGNLLHCCFTKNKGFTRGGEGGRIEEFDWNGNLVWEFWYSSDKYLSHHDIKPLANGNILALAVEKKTLEECVKAGFDADSLRDGELFPDYVIEIKKDGPKSGKIVWEWHVWDHLVQDRNPKKENYGNVAAHPELININGARRGIPAFWNHMNSLDYNPQLDQISLSVRGFNEIWIIDHSTTVKEAASHKGGKRGKGGDLLYRWGNPQAYDTGTEDDRMLFQQHDGNWIPPGYPGEGNLLIFNNGLDRGYSSVDEIVLPVDKNGNYTLTKGKAFGPEKPIWTYKAKNPKDFYSSEISGAHRLPNGNTLICAGVLGTFFEVTSQGETVWKYLNPVVRGGILGADGIPGEDHRGHKLNAVFKIHRYPLDYPAFKGKDLTPGKTIESEPTPNFKSESDPKDDKKGGRDQKGQGKGGGRRDRPGK